MEPSVERSHRVRFASFELDLRSRELREGTRRVPLQEQPFEILRAMLERPGDVVTRDELRRRLWPEGTFVDYEHGLNAAVRRLRAAIGDAADNPRFVETLPRRGYRFIAAPGAPSEDGDKTTALPRRQPVRLAVLPFTNLSYAPAQEYFSDGLTEELIAQLSTTCRGRIDVIARRTSMMFKNVRKGAREIGDALHVSHLLEGSVRCDDHRVRITARLIETAGETHLWSESYERDLSKWCDLTSAALSVQTDVAVRVARALAFELTADIAAPAASPTVAPPATRTLALAAPELSPDERHHEQPSGAI